MVLPPASELASLPDTHEPLHTRPGPTLPQVIRPPPPSDDDLVAGSHPSTVTRAQIAATQAPQHVSYVRVVPRVSGTGVVSNPAGPAAGDETRAAAVTATPTSTRAAFTPQVVRFLKTWLRDRMIATSATGIPYITDQDRAEIADNTGLTVRQVSCVLE